jgi:hypothetical protein
MILNPRTKALPAQNLKPLKAHWSKTSLKNAVAEREKLADLGSKPRLT